MTDTARGETMASFLLTIGFNVSARFVFIDTQVLFWEYFDTIQGAGFRSKINFDVLGFIFENLPKTTPPPHMHKIP